MNCIYVTCNHSNVGVHVRTVTDYVSFTFTTVSRSCISDKLKCLNFSVINFFITGPEFPTRLDLSQEVEDHHPGLHLFTPRREHEEEEPGGV